MAAKQYYLADAPDGSYQALSESTQTAVTIVGGWIVGTGSTNHSEFEQGVERSASTFVGTTVPDGSLDTNLGDAFKTPTLLNGNFAAGDWVVHFVVRAVSNGGAQDGRVRFRLIKADADGITNAVEITSAQQQASIVTDVSTSADFDSTLTFNPGAFSITDQYLFFQIAWERTGAGGMSTADINFRTGSSSSVGTRITTSDFSETLPIPLTPPHPLSYPKIAGGKLSLRPFPLLRPQPAFKPVAKAASPDSATAAWAVNTPVVNQSLAPSAVTAAFAVNTPTLVKGAVTETPSPVTAAWAVNTPTVVKGAVTLTPSPVVATFAVNTPTVVSSGATLTPSPVTAAWAVNTPTLIKGGVTKNPSPVVATFAANTPTVVRGTVTLTPSPVVATFAANTPTIVKGAVTLTPTPITAAWAVNTPTIVTGAAPAIGVAPPHPLTYPRFGTRQLHRFATFRPQPVVYSITTVVISPSAITASFAVNTPTVVRGAITLTPSAVTAAWAVNTPTVVRGAVTKTPTPVVATFAVNTPTVVRGAVTKNPSPVVATFAVNTPVVRQTNAPTPVVATFAVNTPTVVRGAVTKTPTPVVAVWAVNTPTITTGGIVGLFTPPHPLTYPRSRVQQFRPFPSFRPQPAFEPPTIRTTPSAVAATFAVNTSRVQRTSKPNAVVATFAVNTPTLVKGAVTKTPTPVVAVFAVNAPTVVRGTITLTPGARVATFAVNTPTVVKGTRTILPSAVVVVTGVVAPTVVRGPRTIAVSAVTAAWTVPVPGFFTGDIFDGVLARADATSPQRQSSIISGTRGGTISSGQRKAKE